MSIEAMKQALEALVAFEIAGLATFKTIDAITALRQAIEQAEKQCKCPACKIKPHASDCAVHNAPAYPAGECDCGAVKQEPVADGLPLVIAGAIYDFAGYLTTRDNVIEVGSTANASPIADLVVEWAKLRGLSLADAAVLSWQELLYTTQPVASSDTSPERVDETAKQRHEQAQPVAWETFALKFANGTRLSYKKPKDLPKYLDCRPLYTTPPPRQPLTRGQIREIEVDVSLNPSFDYITPAEQLCRAIEAAHGIKEKRNEY